MLVFSNRAIQGDGTNIGDYQDALGFEESSEFRVLDVSNDMNVNVLGTSSNGDFRIAKQALLDFQDQLVDEKLLIYIHGYNNSLESSVERCQELERLYGVKALCLSWPARRGFGNQSHARESVRNARSSKKAFQAMLAIIARTWDREKNGATLSAHSQGCNVYQSVVELGSRGLNHDRFFDNIVLLAPHCKLENHRLWVTRIQPRNKVFITINEGDFTLRSATHVIGMAYKRLGSARHGTDKLIKGFPQIEYVDFAPHVGRKFAEHSYFVNRLDKTGYEKAKPFFEAAFNGRDAGKEVFVSDNEIAGSHVWYVRTLNGVHFPPSLLRRSKHSAS